MKSDKAGPEPKVAFGREGWKNKTPASFVRKAASLLFLCALLGFLAPSAHGAQNSESKVVFLVARRQVQDPFFWHSVVVMLPSVKSPLVVGLIVNKPTRMSLGKLFPKSPAFENRTDHAYFGGPVDVGIASLVFQSPKAPEHAFHVYGDVYLTFDSSLISTVLQTSQPNSKVRLFLGRAQWGPGQLRNEMREGGWYRLEGAGNLIFSTAPQSLWLRLHSRAKPSNYIKFHVPSGASPSVRVQNCDYLKGP